MAKKGESQDGGNKKTKHAKFSDKRTFLNVRGGKENLTCFSLLLPLSWDFAVLPYYWR